MRPTQRRRLVGRVAAGEVFATTLGPGECVEIMTGAECPPGTQAIVPLEQAVCDNGWVRFPEAWQHFQHMALRGSECLRRSALLQPGDLMTPLRVGVLASVGRRDVRVVPAPTLGIITTGGELVADDQLPGCGSDPRFERTDAGIHGGGLGNHSIASPARHRRLRRNRCGARSRGGL